jgi:hypothetical protein
VALTRAQVIREISTFDDVARRRLARLFYDAKAKTYRATLLDLLHRHGETHRRRALLGAEIRLALEREATEHAGMVADTMSRLIRDEAARHKAMSPEQLAVHLAVYARKRAFARAGLVARQEVATARLDAMVGFYLENGSEVEFDFRGPVAECPTCQWLKKNGPHKIDVVLKVAQPHIGCRHHWRARTRAIAALRRGGIRPGRISSGRGTAAGLIGREPFVMAAGGQDEALRQLEAIASAA